MSKVQRTARRASAFACGLAVIVALGGEVGAPAPDFEGEFTKVDARSLADLRGQVVYLEFWRTW